MSSSTLSFIWGISNTLSWRFPWFEIIPMDFTSFILWRTLTLMNICTKMSHLRLNFAYKCNIHYAQMQKIIILFDQRKYMWYDYK